MNRKTAKFSYFTGVSLIHGNDFVFLVGISNGFFSTFQVSQDTVAITIDKINE